MKYLSFNIKDHYSILSLYNTEIIKFIHFAKTYGQLFNKEEMNISFPGSKTHGYTSRVKHARLQVVIVTHWLPNGRYWNKSLITTILFGL